MNVGILTGFARGENGFARVSNDYVRD